MNARQNFHAMMSGQRAAWLPLNIPVTPPVADLIVAHLGVRSAELAFKTDSDFVAAQYPVTPVLELVKETKSIRFS